MLKQIKCDKFRLPIVTFHEGLNVVAGDSNAANSIGKSTMLMIIDFAFGGSSYITKSNDAIDKPLQIAGEAAAIAILRFIKLCNRYLTISSLGN